MFQILAHTLINNPSTLLPPSVINDFISRFQMSNGFSLPPPHWVLPPAASSAPLSLPARIWHWPSRNSLCLEAPPSGGKWYGSHPAESLTRNRPPSGKHTRLPGVPETPLLSLSPPSACHKHAYSPRQQDLMAKQQWQSTDLSHRRVFLSRNDSVAGEYLVWAGLLWRMGLRIQSPTLLRPGMTCGEPKKYFNDGKTSPYKQQFTNQIYRGSDTKSLRNQIWKFNCGEAIKSLQSGM